ncbi:hypothetical protein BT63DRAFT_457198 [Microthyrium microscopicum]|uniref:Uncharacterized protein n=1 Tax=Microthyrium microscopicum TaxID=703497 RepID=A0A6A6U8X7_9PEZI|nr:hypothetical protein BT63DRAFT_457198 [Microthyrium microscopicum]
MPNTQAKVPKATKIIPKAVILIDVEVRYHAELMNALVAYANSGCMVIYLKGLFNVRLVDVKPFSGRFNLPWDIAAYLRSGYVVNPACRHAFQIVSLAPRYNIKACLLKDVDEADKLYVLEPGARYQSLPLQGTGQLGHELTGETYTPAALGAVGEGYIAYFGDVNSENETFIAVVALGCKMHPGLQSAQEPISVSITGAPRMTTLRVSPNGTSDYRIFY